ncbi:MAG: hypothetical protein BGO41_11505 [Clostridiales bacterium 38-18]|nr:MAG: hypothetical protein BGO41_11505 [Clostridiales bacterium 38-18]
MKLKRFAVKLFCILLLSVTLTGCSDREAEVSGTTVKFESDRDSDITEATENIEVLITTGTVDNVEWGDYLHLNITTDSGNSLSFFVLKEVMENPETLKKGQRVTVTYENRKQMMNPPGEEIEFLELLSVTVEQ